MRPNYHANEAVIICPYPIVVYKQVGHIAIDFPIYFRKIQLEVVTQQRSISHTLSQGFFVLPCAKLINSTAKAQAQCKNVCVLVLVKIYKVVTFDPIGKCYPVHNVIIAEAGIEPALILDMSQPPTPVRFSPH